MLHTIGRLGLPHQPVGRHLTATRTCVAELRFRFRAPKGVCGRAALTAGMDDEQEASASVADSLLLLSRSMCLDRGDRRPVPSCRWILSSDARRRAARRLV